MSIRLTKEAPLSFRDARGTKCFECGKCLGFPYVEWNSLFICSSCCRDIKNGLMADMVQAAAIAELRSLGYRGMTLVRMSIDDAEQNDREEAIRYGVHKLHDSK